MPPKAKKSDTAKGDDQPDPLQAVLLTDSYENRFAPFTLEQPRCLLPLANTPLIEYTLEFLASSGVEEVFIYCGNHQDQIEEYLSKTKWMSDASPFSDFQIIRSTSASVGDAMRDLDKREIFHGDFLVLYGDVVANISLESALAAHKRRRAEDKNSIMTMLLREPGSARPIKQSKTPVFIINPQSKRCIHYETIQANAEQSSFTLPPDILKEPVFELRADLLDCGIDICTPDFLALWGDNFDFQTPRENFLHSVLQDYELNGKKIYTHVIHENYVRRVGDLQHYASISKDVISRRSFPFTPDTNLLASQNYQLRPNLVYLDQHINLARSCKIQEKSVIGADCKIGKNTVIANSVIGPGCEIGDGVSIKNSYIWAKVKIGSNTKIDTSIVASGAAIGENCNLLPGSLISYHVVLAEHMSVTNIVPLTTVHRHPETRAIQPLTSDPNYVGSAGTGGKYVSGDDNDSDDAMDFGLVPSITTQMAELSLLSHEDACSDFSDSDDFDDEEDADVDPGASGSVAAHLTSSSATSLTIPLSKAHSRSSSIISSTDDPDTAAAMYSFYREATSSLLDALQRSSPPETVLLELSGLRMGSNASEHAVRRSVAHAFARHILHQVHHGNQGVKEAVTESLTRHAELWRRTVSDRGDAAGDAQKSDQVDLLVCVQRELRGKEQGDVIMLYMLQELVRVDVVEAEGVESWWNSARSVDGEAMVSVRAKCKQLVEFLLEEDDDDDDDDDDEEEEDDDDEDSE